MKVRRSATDWRSQQTLYDPSLESVPYLSWVPPELRALTIDPANLPDRVPPRRRRILIMSSTYMTGGAEVFAVNAARALAPLHDAYLWTQRPGNYTIQGDLPIYDGDPAELVRRHGIDLVIYNNGAAFWHQPNIAATGAKTLLCLHGLVKWNADQFRGHLETINSIDAFWAFSSVAGGLRHMGFRRPSYTLNCPVDGARFPFTRRRWRAPFRIGYVGRVSVEKNLDAVIRLWHRIFQAMGDRVRFEFVGGLDPTNRDPEYLAWLGPVIGHAQSMPEWREMVAAGVLTDHGYSSREHVAEVVRGLHVLTLASDFEGEPVVFTEAMASGALCSFRRVGEVDRQLEGCGLLSTPRGRKVTGAELDEMAASIVDTLRHPARCREMVAAGRLRFEERHAPDAWAGRFVRMMEDVLR